MTSNEKEIFAVDTYGNGREVKCNYNIIKWFHRCNYIPFNVRLSLWLYMSAYSMCKQANLFKRKCTGTHSHTRHFTPMFAYSQQPFAKASFERLICASVLSLVKFKRVNKSLPPEQPSSSPFHVHICSLYVQKSTEARPDSVGIGLAEELEAFQLLASVVPLPRAAGSQLMAMLGTQRERTVADFPIAIAPIPAHHQLQMSHQQLETFRLMRRFSESSGQMFHTFCVLSHNLTLSSLSFHLECSQIFFSLFGWSSKNSIVIKRTFEIFIPRTFLLTTAIPTDLPGV